MRVTINLDHVEEISAEFADNVAVDYARMFLQQVLKYAIPNTFGHRVLAVGKMYENSGWMCQMRVVHSVLTLSHTEYVFTSQEVSKIAEITDTNIVTICHHLNTGDIIRNII